MEITGDLRKMNVNLLNGNAIYRLQLKDKEEIPLNSFLGSEVQISFNGRIVCMECGNTTSKSFSQGYCYPCFAKIPETSPCIIRPELCEAHIGGGRDKEWEQANHNQPHTVYLALTDDLKVGVTRSANENGRWIDQGAWRVIRLAKTPNRYTAGLLEVYFKQFVSDRTNIKGMLHHRDNPDIDIVEKKEMLLSFLPQDLSKFGCDDNAITQINYPLIQPNESPDVLEVVDLKKCVHVGGRLTGIRGQYLFFDNSKVLNLRKHAGFNVDLTLN